MKKTALILLMFAGFASVAHAGFAITFSGDEVDAMTRILRVYAVVSAVIVAVATSSIVFRSARKMKGGVFGTVLNYFGVGMVAVLLGFVASMYPGLIHVEDGGVTSNILFILGYILMAVAAVKLSRAIEGK